MKTKWMKYSVIVTMIALFALVITACGSGSTQTAAASTDVTGVYHAQYDMKDLINQEVEAEGLALESPIEADFTLELKEDQTFVFDVDAAAFGEALVSAMRNDGPKMVKDLLAAEGVEEDMYDSIASLSGYDSFDEFLEDMIENMVSEMKEEMVKELGEDIRNTGTYEVDGNQLTLTAKSGNKALQDGATINDDGSIFLTSQLDDNTVLELTFTK